MFNSFVFELAKSLLQLDCGRSCLSLDINECRGSVKVCDVNANCENTRGSYSCSCKVGFTGDGKSCTGMGVYTLMIYSTLV